jgi:hypothetical protein
MAENGVIATQLDSRGRTRRMMPACNIGALRGFQRKSALYQPFRSGARASMLPRRHTALAAAAQHAK